MKKWLPYVAGAGVLAGVVIGLLFGIALYILALFLVLGAAMLALSRYAHDRILAPAIALVLFCIVLGIARTLLIADIPSPYLLTLTGTRVEIEGIITEEPDRRESADRLIIATEHGKVLVVADPYPRTAYGDRIVATGVLKQPKNFETETGRVFDYESYLKKSDIFFILERSHVEIVAHGEGNAVRALLYRVKDAFITAIERHIPEPESALLNGLLLGSKQSLGTELLEEFRIAGVIHIVVLSGFNMTIIAAAVMYCTRRMLSFRAALVVGAVSIALFAIMVGLSATVVRAAIMAEIGLLALYTGRTYDLARALLIAGVGMVLVSPEILLYDPSFQLSFLATMALILLAPSIEARVPWITKTFGLREIVSATISTQLFLLPFVVWMTGTVSLVALPANLLILPLIPITMALAFFTGVLGYVLPPLAVPFAYGSYLLLSYEITITSWFAHIPYGAYTLPSFSFVWVLSAYAIGAVLWYLHHRKNAQV